MKTVESKVEYSTQSHVLFHWFDIDTNYVNQTLLQQLE